MEKIDEVELDAARKAAYFEKRSEEQEIKDLAWAENNGLSFSGSGALQNAISASKALALEMEYEQTGDNAGVEMSPVASIRDAVNAVKSRKVMVSMRMDPQEIDGFKKLADAEGMPYQTLMKSVLHKFLNGELVRKTAI